MAACTRPPRVKKQSRRSARLRTRRHGQPREIYAGAPERSSENAVFLSEAFTLRVCPIPTYKAIPASGNGRRFIRVPPQPLPPFSPSSRRPQTESDPALQAKE